MTTIRPGVVSKSEAMDTVKAANSTHSLTRQVLTADTLLDLIRLVY